MSAPAAFAALVRRDLALAVQSGGGTGAALAFFASLVVLLPFAIGPDLATLSRLAPALLWAGALLASLLTLDRLFAADLEDGSLDLIRSGPLPLEAVGLAKALVHWLTTGLPLSLAAPVLGLFLAIPAEAVMPVTVSLLVGTPALSALGTMGAAVTAGLRRGGVLTAVLVLPLAVPVLVFGAGAADWGLGGPANLALLGAASLITNALAPFAVAAGLRAEG